jgi:hypothetical protein
MVQPTRSNQPKSERRTKAVNSCGLEISLGARFLAVAGCFVAPFTFGPEIFGVLLGLGEAGTFSGAGPIVDIAELKEYEG